MILPVRRVAWVLALVLAAPVGLIGHAAGTGPSEGTGTASRAASRPAAAERGGSAMRHRFGDGSQVTVSQTANLIHQVVQVRWSGMKPTTYVGSIDNGGGSTDAVDVVECWGTHPRREDCWYAPSTMQQPYRNDDTAYTSWTVPGDPAETAPYTSWWSHQISPEFVTSAGTRICPQYGCAHDVAGITAAPDYSLLPTNEQLGQTAADGRGSVGFEVRTRAELPSLGCDSAHPCSLVVIPTDRPITGGTVTAADAAASTEFAFRFTAGHWDQRAVFPLHFARQTATCPFASDQTPVTSSEAAASAVVRWQPALCTEGSGGTRVAAALTTEPDSLIRTQLAAGAIPIGLLNRPVTGAVRPLATAPVVASGVAVSFVIDDARTGAPVRRLRLNARLVAKLLTESYCSFVCGTDPDYPADPNVRGNPELIWQDPELRKLNPGVTFFSQGAYAPEMEYFDSDAFYDLTRWIEADPTARAWLRGKPDPWGMKVNKAYLRWQLPTSAPVKLDPWEVPVHNPLCVPQGAGECVYNGQDLLDLKYQFVNSMDAAAQDVTVAQSSDASNNQPDPLHAGRTVFGKVAPAAYPNRAVLGVMTTSQAATLGLPMAQLLNGRGQFVAPTTRSLRAAMAAMSFDHATQTYDLDPSSTASGVYPLTMVQSVVAPASGLTRGVAAKVAAIIRYAIGPGQVPGTGLGQLPAGYVPVTAAMHTQAAHAAAEVAAQAAHDGPTGPSPAPGPSTIAQPAPIPTEPIPPPTPTAGPAPTEPGRGGGSASTAPTPAPLRSSPTARAGAASPAPTGAAPPPGASLAAAAGGDVASPVAAAAGAAPAAAPALSAFAVTVSAGGGRGRWALAAMLAVGIAAGLAALVLAGGDGARRLAMALRPRVRR